MVVVVDALFRQLSWSNIFARNVELTHRNLWLLRTFHRANHLFTAASHLKVDIELQKKLLKIFFYVALSVFGCDVFDH